jgi:hypothetical protein
MCRRTKIRTTSEEISNVIVNGVPVLRDGTLTAALPGAGAPGSE